MNAIQQKCRPKHQVLVLKCYPRTTKGAVDVKPNSSELSYLLFYATSRRSKIQKVGQFLEKKTASDVWRVRIGNVQVTLQILAALIEKAPKDLPLFAQNVLKILDLVLRSNDITMVDASLPTFRTFCEHHDVSSLIADQAYLRQYEQVVRAYAAFASTRKVPGKPTDSKPVALRWRNAGLEAIKSVAESDALSSVAGRQLDVIVPMILENLWTDNEEFLDVLSQRVEVEEKDDPNALLRRRTSVSTIKTADTGGDANPIAISGTSVDIDKLAEEDIGVVAMQCLKQIFVIPNRAQINGATAALLRFIKERVQQKESVVVQSEDGRSHGWAIKIFELATRWAPVQDRYVIMITTTDTLLRTAPTEENMADQIVLTAIIGSLLSSDINLIGLSVMDVLTGLIQHMKRVLKYSSSSRGSNGSSGDEKPPSVTDLSHISIPYRELLTRIQQSIGNLATHVYYADQISDMISTILLRLKPHPSTAANASPAPEKTEALAGASAANVSDDQSHLDSYFALDLAKTTALRAIKSILLVANPKTKVSGNVSLTRNKVPIQVWEGTHWLLRDPDGQVRKAYVDALGTWLDRETTSSDLIARDDLGQKQRANNREMPSASIARRAVSSASNRDKPVKTPRSRFLQLLHLAIYDSARQFVEFQADIALLHVLLTKLVNKLGVNAARYGVPMIFRLQEDILEAETPAAKFHLGCLCHGYFWALSEHFEFEASPVGRAIHNEIVRRRSKHFWVEGVHVPTPSLELLEIPGSPKTKPKVPTREVESEALLPFDDRVGLVECICKSYKERAVSPPSSPATSPGRSFSHPILNSTLSAIPPATEEHELPTKFKEEMLAEWNREAVVIALQAESKSASLSGSKTGTTVTKGNHLTVNGPTSNGYAASRPESAYARQNNLRPTSHASHMAALRNSSAQSHGSGRTSSSRGFVASVDQLKSVLTGDPARPATFQTLQEDGDSSDSMASYEFTPSELSFNPNQADGGEANDATLARSRSKSRERKASGDSGGPLTSHPTEGDEEDEGVPPVPPLPADLVGKSPPPEINPERLAKVSSQDHAVKAQRNSRSRGGDSILSSHFSNAGAASMDLQAMLKGIDSKSKQNTLGNLTKPPY
ncbi:hypothetical protein K445DRAFT_318289 [Daldinia sp. EC12]|nr:hypothetical protein K445DRAFT_318289 [Daldinia sp. EC12]